MVRSSDLFTFVLFLYFPCRFFFNIFLPISKSFKTEGAGRLGLQIPVSNQSVWEQLVTDSDAPGTTQSSQEQEKAQARSYDRLALETFLSQDSWHRADQMLSDFVGQTLLQQLQPSNGAGNPTAAGTKSSSSRKKRRQKKKEGAHEESEVYCEAWKSMMDTMSADKKIRKVCMNILLFLACLLSSTDFYGSTSCCGYGNSYSNMMCVLFSFKEHVHKKNLVYSPIYVVFCVSELWTCSPDKCRISNERQLSREEVAWWLAGMIDTTMQTALRCLMMIR